MSNISISVKDDKKEASPALLAALQKTMLNQTATANKQLHSSMKQVMATQEKMMDKQLTTLGKALQKGQSAAKPNTSSKPIIGPKGAPKAKTNRAKFKKPISTATQSPIASALAKAFSQNRIPLVRPTLEPSPG